MLQSLFQVGLFKQNEELCIFFLFGRRGGGGGDEGSAINVFWPFTGIQRKYLLI